MANGMSDEVVTWIAIAMNLGNVLIVLLSTVLMDRVGRRVLLLTSMISMVEMVNSSRHMKSRISFLR